jgi:hypothetical protein
MELIWCFHCKKTVPMVDDREWETLWQGMRTSKGDEHIWQDLYKLTGETPSLTTRKRLLSHRRSHYGDPCPKCGRLFRTPRAKFCAECGFRPNNPSPGSTQL